MQNLVEGMTAEQMRAREKDAIASGAVTGLELMERAGTGVLEAAFKEWPEFAQGPHRAIVLCGPGNNGGDGFVIARLLKNHGWDVEVFATESKTPDAIANRNAWDQLGAIQDLTYRAFKMSADADLYVDAVFGIGLSRPVTGDLGHLLRYLAGYGGDGAFFKQRTLAVDVPSGLDADTGEVPGAGPEEWAPSCSDARLTVTFHAPKIGHLIGKASPRCGTVVVKDIGI